MTACVTRVVVYVGVAFASLAPAAAWAQARGELARRDPFVPVVKASPPPVAPVPAPAPVTAPRAAGLAGVSAADVVLTGVLGSGSARIALLEVSGGKTYLARIGDRLHDSVVWRIDPHEVVLVAGEGAHEVRTSLRFAHRGGR